jgi:hypothetical protein
VSIGNFEDPKIIEEYVKIVKTKIRVVQVEGKDEASDIE